MLWWVEFSMGVIFLGCNFLGWNFPVTALSIPIQIFCKESLELGHVPEYYKVGYITKMVGWFQLTNIIVWNNTLSCRQTGVIVATILSGVPQDTVLGSLLLLVCMNDLEDSVKHQNAELFVDDTRMSKQISCAYDCEPPAQQPKKCESLVSLDVFTALERTLYVRIENPTQRHYTRHDLPELHLEWNSGCGPRLSLKKAPKGSNDYSTVL